MRFGRLRDEPFDDLVARQLRLFAEDEAELLAEAVEAERAWVGAGREAAEESYGDYQLVVDAIADALLSLRDTYAQSLAADTADGYRRAFASAVAKQYRRYASVVADLEP